LVVPSISPLPAVSGAAALTGSSATSGAQANAGDFGTALTRGIDALQQLQAHADDLATQAATGSLADITSYMIASNEAAIATELTTAVRDKAIAAFTSIMNMQM
jgi:flagellar hook-basal body complex protein FliE